MSYIFFITRSIVAFLAIFLLTRLIGKRQISQFSFFNYAVGITIGSIAATISVDNTLKLDQGLVSLVLWGALAVCLSYLILNNRSSRNLLSEKPTFVIKNGLIQQDALRKLRLNVDDLGMLLRREKIFDITDAEFAVFETDGKLSVLKRAEQQNVTRKDLNLSQPVMKYLPSKLIEDGHMVDKNLKEINQNQEWLNNHIKAQGYKGANEIFFAEVLSDGSIFLSPTGQKPKSTN